MTRSPTQTATARPSTTGSRHSDIAIAQNAKQNGLAVFSTDKHMNFLSNLMAFDLRVE